MTTLSTSVARRSETVCDHPAEYDGPSLIRHLLEGQSQLTAVELFSLEHDLAASADAQYSHLMPATPSAEGQQYAFHVDLDRCSGCKACVTACHSLNGLDEGETWRDVGLLIGGTEINPVMQHVTTACHHCLEPACMSACPVDAYEKDALTGIVRHLDDQCFGCRYCTLACPYDVPKYHPQKGIVRKCDMCSARLGIGEAPACVQACPHEAIAIQVVDVERVIEDSEAVPILPTAPDSEIAYPSTTYTTRRSFPRNLLPADYHASRAQHPHWSLIVMLVLTQLSVGAFVAGLVFDSFHQQAVTAAMRPLHVRTAAAFGLVALGASLFHLGRPLLAYRAVIGLKHSWLSREIVAFGIFAALSIAYALSGVVESEFALSLQATLSWAVALAGLVGVLCSVMVYSVTRREFWRFESVGLKFFLSTALLGIAASWLTILLLGLQADSPSAELADATGKELARALIAVSIAKLCFEVSVFRHLVSRRVTPLKRSARLAACELSSATLARFACGLLGGVVMPVFLLSRPPGTTDAVLIVLVAMLFVACLAGELLERYLFFAAVAPTGMPGSLPT
ncbi:MAG: DmsC/YnfH family molybdoenzyme membrane anchor subunit [Planctomycetaceae bacterium]